MDDQNDDPAARAFIRLEARVAEVVRTLEEMAARETLIPDYSATLAGLIKRLQTAIKGNQAALKHIAAADAAASARTLAVVREEVAAQWKPVLRDLSFVTRQSRDHNDQRQQVRRVGIGAATVSVLIMATVPGAIARSLPRSWSLPQWMAARVLRSDTVQNCETSVLRSSHRPK